MEGRGYARNPEEVEGVSPDRALTGWGDDNYRDSAAI